MNESDMQDMKDTIRNAIEDGLAPTIAQRRERIATAVLTGMWANVDYGGSFHRMVHDALACADALIAELDKGDT